MKKFRFEMLETRVYAVIYTVEARNADSARRKALAGDTVGEEEVKMCEVSGRDIWELVEGPK